jgi:hypothetical protein
MTLFGKVDWRNQHQVFGIKVNDRFGHIYCIGKTGTGKSTLLLNMALSDMHHGNGICIIDPHGDLAKTILNHVPHNRIQDVVYFDATDVSFPIGFNLLNNVSSEQYGIVTAGLISAFKKIWIDSWGPRLEHILRYCILSLLHFPSATLLDIQPLLSNVYFRQNVLAHIQDDAILSFWKNEYEKYSPQFRNEATAPILNKTGILGASTVLRNIIGQQRMKFSIVDIANEKKIFICNLAKGMIGEDASTFLGSMILTAIQSAMLNRATSKEEERVPFYLYVDEMHSFMTLSFADILAESRKYKLGLFLTHQYIEQLKDEIRAAVFGNVGTIISFRVGATDAEYLAKEFYPVFTAQDLISLPRFSMYLKLMIDGTTSKPFSAVSLSLPSIGTSYADQIIATSRLLYGRERKQVVKDLHEYFTKFNQSSGLTLFS